MQPYSVQLQAVPVNTDTKFIDTAGTFVRYDEETSGAANPKITFKTDRGDQFVLKPGQSVELERQFARISLANRDLVSNIAATVVVGGAGARVNDSNIIGTLTLTGAPVGSAHSYSSPAVSNASGQKIAANANRKYLAVQNQDAAGNVWIRGDGVVAVAGVPCLKLRPGESWEPPVAPTGAVMAIGDIANNPNVTFIEA